MELVGQQWKVDSKVARQAALGPYPTYDPLPLPKPTKLAIRKKEANYTRVKGEKEGQNCSSLPLFYSSVLSFLPFSVWPSPSTVDLS